MEDTSDEAKGEGQGEEDEDGGDDEGAEGPSGFALKWGWISLVDSVSEVTRLDWHRVFEMGITEFFNIVCYTRDKAENERIQLERWKQKQRT